ncbi:pentatricopeptide repeat-containing protein [Canna indica]|uniref:Pentatricopeptide repeat-containing protein n=1 Tax=Canna indica TaxID=4628 RepID=A0AAQ3K166_9LILI|nr:pentatricopeptide repeat-containing protein [Canna indica]
MEKLSAAEKKNPRSMSFPSLRMTECWREMTETRKAAFSNLAPASRGVWWKLDGVAAERGGRWRNLLSRRRWRGKRPSPTWLRPREVCTSGGAPSRHFRRADLCQALPLLPGSLKPHLCRRRPGLRWYVRSYPSSGDPCTSDNSADIFQVPRTQVLPFDFLVSGRSVCHFDFLFVYPYERMIRRLSTKMLNVCVASLCKVHNLDKAEAVIIDGIRLGCLPDVVTYNTLINAYCRLVGIDEAYLIIRRMREAGIKPDVITYNSLIAGATRCCLPSRSLDLFEEMLQNGLVPDDWSYNTLIHCLFKCGHPEDAYKIYMDMISKNVAPTSTTYNTLINGMCKSGNAMFGLRLFRYLEMIGFSAELVTYNTIIDGLCKSGRIGEARKILRELGKSNFVPNAVTYTTVMKCCFRSGRFEQGIQIFDTMMNKGYTADIFAYCAAISALIKKGYLEEANSCVEQMLRNGVGLDRACYNTIIYLQCREGKLDYAFQLVNEMEEKAGFGSDQYTYTILIDALCKMGYIDAANKHLHMMEMRGFHSNLVAYNCLIDGLCKLGEVDLALKIFNDIKSKDDFSYTSIVHGLCRKSRFRIASKILLNCLKEGSSVLTSAHRAVIAGLRSAGFKRDARKLREALRVSRLLRGCHHSPIFLPLGNQNQHYWLVNVDCGNQDPLANGDCRNQLLLARTTTFLYNAGSCNSHEKVIGITQPPRVAAVTVAQMCS